MALQGRAPGAGIKALPTLPAPTGLDPGQDGGHSPDAFVEAEELLVGQPLTLEDSNHPVVDTVDGREE